MSKIYNKNEPKLIIHKANTDVSSQYSDAYKFKPYYLNNIIKNDEEQIIIPFYLIDKSDYNVFNITYSTHGGGSDFYSIGNSGHIINLQEYKEIINKKSALSSYFNSTQLALGWNNYKINSEYNIWGSKGGGSWSYSNGLIHFLNLSSTSSVLNYSPIKNTNKLSVSATDNSRGSSIIVNGGNFNLGYNAIISAKGLSNYFNNIKNQPVYNQWITIGIKGGYSGETTYNSPNYLNLKFYSLNETDPDVSSQLLTKRELSTDVWYIEDENFRTFSANKDAYYDECYVYSTFSYLTTNSTSYYCGNPSSYNSTAWTDEFSAKTIFSSTDQATALLSHIPTARYTTYRYTDPTIPHINISQLLLINSNSFTFDTSQFSGFNITANSGNKILAYSGSNTAYQPTAWFETNSSFSHEFSSRYFVTVDEATPILNQINLTNKGVHKTNAVITLSSHYLKPVPSGNWDMISLNYFIKLCQ